jgi:formiminoglutamase
MNPIGPAPDDPAPVEVFPGDGPVILGQPHGGTGLPNDVRAALNDTGRALSDTDWHIGRLYDGLLPGATVVRATFHRYVVDANRPPDGASLYPGRNTTGLVPLTDFDGTPIWSTPPDAAGIARRRDAFHAPYHAALAAEVARIRAIHGIAVVYDCHSIRSRIPYLFDGVLPDLNIGTDGGTTCAPALQAIAAEVALSSPFSAVINGRFKGGWTTRHYGRPGAGVHAIQMEIAQSAYLAAEGPPWTWDPARAGRLRPWLGDILSALADTALDLAKDAT